MPFVRLLSYQTQPTGMASVQTRTSWDDTVVGQINGKAWLGCHRRGVHAMPREGTWALIWIMKCPVVFCFCTSARERSPSVTATTYRMNETRLVVPWIFYGPFDEAPPCNCPCCISGVYLVGSLDVRSIAKSDLLRIFMFNYSKYMKQAATITRFIYVDEILPSFGRSI
jgi:hypothetical protein